MSFGGKKLKQFSTSDQRACEIAGALDVLVTMMKAKMPITHVFVTGSFITDKERPADIDLIVMVKVKPAHPEWSTDIVFVPDNEYGDSIIEDTKKWMEEKYGTKQGVIEL